MAERIVPSFRIEGFEGAFAVDPAAGDAAGAADGLAQAVARLVDPASADATIHWGRNYLYRTTLAVETGAAERDAERDDIETIEVVVKQFRNQGRKRRVERRLRGSKAERSWRMALAYQRARLPTPAPVAWIESTEPEGPSFFVTRFVPGLVELRYPLRAMNAGTFEADFPALDRAALLDSVGKLLARQHAVGLFHRDLSIGNVLFPEGVPRPTADDLVLLDLNRARQVGDLSLAQRLRDLCRLTIYQPADRARFLAGYWGDEPSAAQRMAFRGAQDAFRAKLATKRWVRAPFRALASALAPRRAHVHIPAAPEGASARDKIVWDALSDQPHQHAGKLDKLRVRLADGPGHLYQAGLFLRAAPRVTREYRRLRRELWREPVPWRGVGVAVRPHPDAPDAVPRALIDLGVDHALLRLHPWQAEHDAEEALARQLVARGIEVAFALPQTRDLVRQPALWRERVEEMAERFLPYGSAFQVGQAINRSKWGVWRVDEYLALARDAAGILRQRALAEGRPVEIFGPAVIDFELHATLAVLEHPRAPQFDGVSHLLYVDRRGAPENRQLGFDSLDKLALARAIGAVSRNGSDRSWITEVNWPLREGPHSPAGKSVAVTEEEQADFLQRFYLLALGTGLAERVYWWQLVARGYGLVAPHDADGDAAGLRRRPAFAALATLQRELRGLLCVGWEEGTRLAGPLPPAARILRFERPLDGGGDGDPEGEALWVVWSVGDPCEIRLREAPREVVSRDGSIVASASDHSAGESIGVSASPRFLRF